MTSKGRLLRLDRATGEILAATAISGIGDGETILGADVRPANGVLYVLTDAPKLYAVDVNDGTATLASTLLADATDTSAPFAGLAGNKFGVDFNPVPDRLRIVSDQGQNLRVNVDTGATITDTALNPGTPQVVAAAYTNSFAAACRTRLFVIDQASGSLQLQDPPNDGRLTPIGSLGLDGGELLSFEITTSSDGTNAALLAQATKGGATLYDVDLDSGAASAPRKVRLKPRETLIGLSSSPPAVAPVQAVGELLGLTTGNRLVSFNRGAPAKLCTSNPITGLEDPNEEVLGIDVRPADGSLYAVGSANRIYTLDPASGAATLKSTLIADPTDTSDPFTGLSHQEMGTGFNPVPDRLRLIGRDGTNLRVNVDTGAVITDVSITPAGVEITALGYTNSVAGATSTTLYALDTAADALVRVGGDPATGGACTPPPGDVGNPNCGVTTSIGALSVGDASELSGFDIAGTTGNALAALVIDGAPTSTLFSVDLATGTATLPAGVANGTIGGGESLRGLAFSAD